MKNKDIKKHAINLLTSNWGQALAVVLIILIIHLIFAIAEESVFKFLKYKGEIDSSDFMLISKNKYMIIINIARTLIGFIIIVPAYIGAVWWYLHCVRGENNSIKSMFVCYENKHIFIKSLALKLTTYLIKLMVGLPVCALIILQYKLIKITLNRGMSNGVLVILIGCCAIFTVCCICFYIVFALRYALVDYIFVLNPDLKIGEIIKTSTEKMKDNKIQIVKLFLSFLWWIPSCILVFPAFFVVPYYAMSLTVMMNSIIEKNFTMERNVLVGRRTPSIIS